MCRYRGVLKAAVGQEKIIENISMAYALIQAKNSLIKLKNRVFQVINDLYSRDIVSGASVAVLFSV